MNTWSNVNLNPRFVYEREVLYFLILRVYYYCYFLHPEFQREINFLLVTWPVMPILLSQHFHREWIACLVVLAFFRGFSSVTLFGVDPRFCLLFLHVQPLGPNDICRWCCLLSQASLVFHFCLLSWFQLMIHSFAWLFAQFGFVWCLVILFLFYFLVIQNYLMVFLSLFT